MKHALNCMLLTLVLMFVGIGNVWGETYEITFATSTSDGNTVIEANADIPTVVASGDQYISGFTSNCTKAFYNSKKGIKLGNTNVNGKVEFTIAASYQQGIRKITLVSAQYNTDTSTKLTLYNGGTSLSSSITPGIDYTHTFTEPTTVSTIRISASGGRAYVSKVILETEDTPSLPQLDTPTELTSTNITSKTATLSWTAVANANGYTVKIGTKEYTSSSTSYSASGLSASTEYSWTVKANGDGTQYSDSEYATSATFTTDAPATYTISWYINGELNRQNNLAEGSSVEFSSHEDTPGNSDKVFVGWTDHEILTPTNTKPELFTTATVTENKSYYAVFADKEDGGDPSYIKLESNNFKTGVEYVIGAEQASGNSAMWYFYSYDNSTNQVSWGKMATISSAYSPIVFSLSQNPEASKEYYAKDNNNYYLDDITANKFKMSSEKTAFTLGEDGTIINHLAETWKLRFNYLATGGGLRWYNTETGTPAYFYEVVGGVTYSNYTTRISTGPVEPKITATNITIEIDEEKKISELFSSNSSGTMSYEVSSTPGNAVYTFLDGVFSAKTTGIYQITLTQEAVEGKYTGGTATANITVKKKTATLKFSTTECTGDLNAPNAFREPVLTTNPADISVTYSSSSTSIAQVDATTGKITLKGEGTTIITAKFDGNDEYAEATAQYMLTVEDSSDPIITFTRVTSADELEDWGTYIIAKRNVAASEKEIPVMGHLSGNNRDAITAEYDGATITLHRSQIAQNSDQATGYARQIYLVQNGSYWNLYDAIDEQYLCAEKGVNALKNTTDDNADNALATIVINSGTFCYATITFQTDDKRKLGYNMSSGGLFSAYTSLSSSNEVALFKKTERTQKVITLWDTTNKRDSKYEQAEVERYDEIKYVRTFKDNNWQALYIPFSMEVDEVGSEYKIAALNNMHQYDKDGDGVLDNSMAMEVNVLNTGTLKPNHPYLIKYTGSGTVDKTFTVTNADLYPATVTEIDCASMNRKYTFTGNYSELTGLVTLGAYSMSGGALQSAVNDESKLPCYRWYMTMTDLDDQMLHPEEMPSEIKVVVNGMWDETSISAPQAEGNDTWIELCGIRHIGRPRPGVYLHNGRKVFVR